jgi:chitinase
MKNKGKLYSIALAALLLFFLIFGSSVALAGTETRLTHGERLTYSTAIYGTNVFWTETTANGVHAYDLATGKRTDINGNYAVEKINAYGNKVGSPLFRVDIITKTNAGKLKKHLIHKE